MLLQGDTLVIAWGRQDQNGKEAWKDIEGKPGRVHRGRLNMKMKYKRRVKRR